MRGKTERERGRESGGVDRWGGVKIIYLEPNDKTLMNSIKVIEKPTPS